jgi:hypothetical protein
MNSFFYRMHYLFTLLFFYDIASSFFSCKLTNNYRNFTFIRTYFIVVLLQHNKLVERQQQHSIVVIQYYDMVFSYR